MLQATPKLHLVRAILSPSSCPLSSLNFPYFAFLYLLSCYSVSLSLTSFASTASHLLTRQSPLSSRFLSHNNYYYSYFELGLTLAAGSSLYFAFSTGRPLCRNEVGSWKLELLGIFEREENSFTVRSLCDGIFLIFLQRCLRHDC